MIGLCYEFIIKESSLEVKSVTCTSVTIENYPFIKLQLHQKEASQQLCYGLIICTNLTNARIDRICYLLNRLL